MSGRATAASEDLGRLPEERQVGRGELDGRAPRGHAAGRPGESRERLGRDRALEHAHRELRLGGLAEDRVAHRARDARRPPCGPGGDAG